MHFPSAAVSCFLLSASGVASFSQKPTAFVSSRVASITSIHSIGCMCAACTGRLHGPSCACPTCFRSRRTTILYADDVEQDTAAPSVEDDVPPEVEALDGIKSEDEAHNTERPARKSLKKKPPKGKALSEFAVGDSVTARVKSVTTYGAFMDIGATTDGLLHISQLSVEYVNDVSTVLQVGQDVDVRIIGIDEKKNQVALSLLSATEEQEVKDANKSRQQQKRDQPERSQRRDDSQALAQLVEKGWDPEQFVDGTVVSTVDFGAFVRIDVSQLNPEITGEIDGLVHISALTAGRAQSVTSVVNVDDKVKVRVKGIAKNKVSLSMISPEDEQQSSGGGSYEPQSNLEWKEDLVKIQAEMPTFRNGPVVVDRRK